MGNGVGTIGPVQYDLGAEQLFWQLCQACNQQPDRRGEVHVPCPNCGKEPRRGHVHFSFSVTGGHCFVCGYGIGLQGLAQSLLDARPSPGPPFACHPKCSPRPARASVNWDAMAANFQRHPQLNERWQEYADLPPEIIAGYRLGYGAFRAGSSRCRHGRLMVPLIAEGRVVGFRGRRQNCECDGKWLSPAGSTMVLYNGERLGQRGPSLGLACGDRLARDRALYIVENPIDALALERLSADVAAVATLGVGMWKDEWTEMIKACRPAGIVVAFDNDRPGNGGGARGCEEWARDHGTDVMPNGIRLVNRLLAAGLNAELLDWGDAPLKTDIGDLLRRSYSD